MGGLRRPMPVTFVTMTVGLAALAGLPPFAGFFSKEAVLGAAEETALHHDGPAAAWTGWLVLVVGPRDRRRHRGVRHPALAADVLRRAAQPRSPRTSRRPRCAGRWSCSPSRRRCSGSSGSPPAGCRSGWRRCRSRTGRDVAQVELHLDLVTSVLSVVLAASAALPSCGASGGATRRPTRRCALGRRGRPSCTPSTSTTSTTARVVRPVRLAARAVRRTDDDVVRRRACVGTGRGARWLSGAVARTQSGNVHDVPHRPARRACCSIVAGVVVLT